MTKDTAKAAKRQRNRRPRNMRTSAYKAYLRGFERGYNCASWQDLPEIGSVVRTDSDGKVTIDEDNQWDVVCSLAWESESMGRDFSPFEFTAHEFNESEESEELWEAFDAGIGDGINANVAERKALAAR